VMNTGMDGGTWGWRQKVKTAKSVTVSKQSDTQAGRPLRMSDAVTYLGVSRSTILRLMARGQLRGHKVGSQWRFWQEDLAAAMKPAQLHA
jgi:excisionase family DNA binding protein